MWTLNNPEELKFGAEIKYAIWQLEKGEAGTLHFQGYLVLEKPARLSGVRKIPGLERAHFEIRRGTHIAARDYASKEDTRIAGPWTHGTEPVGSGRRSDLLDVQKILKEKGHEGLKEIGEEHFGSFIRYNRGFKEYLSLQDEPRSGEIDVRYKNLQKLHCLQKEKYFLL